MMTQQYQSRKKYGNALHITQTVLIVLLYGLMIVAKHGEFKNRVQHFSSIIFNEKPSSTYYRLCKEIKGFSLDPMLGIQDSGSATVLVRAKNRQKN